MIPLGTLIGGALSAGSQLASGLLARKAAQEAKANNAKLQAENEAWYNRRWNENATQRADAQEVLRHFSEQLRNRNKAAEGAAAVAGGNEAALAAQKAANSQAYADAVGNIAAQGAARKDAIEDKYMQRKEALTAQNNAIEQQRAASMAAAGAALGNAFGSAGNAVDDYLDGRAGVTTDNEIKKPTWQSLHD